MTKLQLFLISTICLIVSLKLLWPIVHDASWTTILGFWFYAGQMYFITKWADYKNKEE